MPTAPGPRRQLGLLDLVLFHVAAIVSVRWISLAAANGPASLGLWGLALAAFFWPAGYVVLDATRRSPEAGGFATWTRAAFGPFHGFLCAWCYVVSNLFYFPALLVAIAGYAIFVNPAAAPSAQPSATFVIAFSLAALAGVTALGVAGLRYGKWLQNLGALATWAPCALLVALGAVTLGLEGSATPFDRLFPEPGAADTWRVWSSICFAFAGFELATCFLGEIRDPERTVPRSIAVAGLGIAGVYVLGTIAVLVCLAPGEASALNGILQAISAVFARFGLGAATPLVAALLTIGGIAGVSAWFSGAARLPRAMEVDRFLPGWLTAADARTGAPRAALLVQGALAAAFVLASFAGSTVTESYQVLTDATTILYFIPYGYLFAAHARTTLADRGKRPIALPLFASATGLASTLVALVFSAVPPADSERPLLFTAKVVLGSFGLAAVAGALYAAARRRARRAGITAGASPGSSLRPGSR